MIALQCHLTISEQTSGSSNVLHHKRLDEHLIQRLDYSLDDNRDIEARPYCIDQRITSSARQILDLVDPRKIEPGYTHFVES